VAPFVIDASVAASWCFHRRNDLHRSSIVIAHAEVFLEDLKSFRIRLTDPLSYGNVFALADRHGLTVYDAAYLDIAIREGVRWPASTRSFLKSSMNSRTVWAVDESSAQALCDRF
jgi:hypothetical protein